MVLWKDEIRHHLSPDSIPFKIPIASNVLVSTGDSLRAAQLGVREKPPSGISPRASPRGRLASWPSGASGVPRAAPAAAQGPRRAPRGPTNRHAEATSRRFGWFGRFSFCRGRDQKHREFRWNLKKGNQQGLSSK